MKNGDRANARRQSAGLGSWKAMNASFVQLNHGWNAEPNAPEPEIEVEGSDIVLRFLVNPFQYPAFKEGEAGILRFVNCARYRLGETNDEGWYRGECRFGRSALKWGEFYLVSGDKALLEAPRDWKVLGPSRGLEKHFLFYFKDHTFECVAERCVVEPSTDNSLLRSGFAGC